MCRCTPEIRTPWCGKPGCEMPPQKAPSTIVEEPPPKRQKGCYIGAPAVFQLDLCCQHLNEAFDSYGCFQVGSSLERPDWRDVDVRMIMPDEAFFKLFPDASVHSWSANPRWQVMTVAISGWLKQQTGLPIDFQFQPASHANSKHKGPRNALGMKIRVTADA